MSERAQEELFLPHTQEISDGEVVYVWGVFGLGSRSGFQLLTCGNTQVIGRAVLTF